MRAREADRAREQAFVQIAPAVDKYALADLPQIDCAARISLCQGRCCRLSFPLSFQDLDERVVKWDYSRPYQIRRREDGYCTHSDEETRGCRVYENRPAICRTYDCRNDKRIWVDFDKRIPAPLEAAPLPPSK
jgi:Fe-S-cluster containining protein